MASIFKRMYDWLLRLFWLVAVSSVCCCALIAVQNAILLSKPVIEHVLTMSTVIQGHGDGYHDDRIAECREDIIAEGSCGKLSIIERLYQSHKLIFDV